MSASVVSPKSAKDELSRIRRLAQLDDVALGARLLRGAPTNEARPDGQLTEWSRRAQAFGGEFAGRVEQQEIEVVERDGGLRDGDAVIARYRSRTHAVDLFVDSIAYCERLVDDLGWRELFPAGSIRAAAIAHENAHEVIGRDHARALREAVGHELFHVGRFRRYAYVAGADELAAHAFAQASTGLERSPLLITAAAVAALDGPSDVLSGGDAAADADTSSKEN